MMLDVRKLVLSVAAAGAAAGLALAAGAASAQTVDGPKVNWKISTLGPPRAQTAGIEKLAELGKERTNGNFTIDIGFAEQFAPARAGRHRIHIGRTASAQRREESTER